MLLKVETSFVDFFPFYLFFVFQQHNLLLKGIQVKFFTLDQNIGIWLRCVLTKVKLSTPSRFQDIAVQN